jgi:ribonuclease HI
LVNRKEKLNIAYNSDALLLSDPQLDKKTVRVIGNVVYAVWQARKFLEIDPARSAISMLLATYYNLTTGVGAKATELANKALRKKVRSEEAHRLTNQFLASLPPDSLIIYTDGSSFGNPGPSGAGLVVYYKGSIILVYSVGLGNKGTNNDGECVALGLALQFVNFTKLSFSKSVIVTDSEHAKNIATGKFKTKTSTVVSQSLIAAFNLNLATVGTEIHWTPGHAGLEGNDQADKAAKSGAKESFAGHFQDMEEWDFLHNPDEVKIQILPNVVNSPRPLGSCSCANCLKFGYRVTHSTPLIVATNALSPTSSAPRRKSKNSRKAQGAPLTTRRRSKRIRALNFNGISVVQVDPADSDPPPATDAPT